METMTMLISCGAVSDDTFPAVIDFCYEPATGDGWHEPKYPESVEIDRVKSVEIDGDHDITDMLSPEELDRLKSEILEARSIDAAERKADKDEHDREAMEQQLRRFEP